MKAILCGANGAMGRLIGEILGSEIVGRVSLDGEHNVPRTFAELGLMEADVLIDFSHHSATPDVLDYAKKVGCAVSSAPPDTPPKKKPSSPIPPG